MKKKLKILFVCLVSLIVLILLTFIPTLNLKTKGMVSITKEHFIIYYEKKDENAAMDISSRLQKGYDSVSSMIKIRPDYKTKVYIYPDLNELHMKKYGLLGRIFGPEWYIGDNIKNKVIIVSPNSPGKMHDYESVANAALHEYVHTLMWSINPKLSLFLNESMAGYISGNTKPAFRINHIPTYEDTKISNPLTFGNSGMYEISYTYIEYLDKTYGMQKVMQLVKTQDYFKTFGKSERSIFEEYVQYYKLNYFSDISLKY